MANSIADSPVWDEYLRQTAGHPDDLVNLTALWRAAGSPRGQSPRNKYRNNGWIVRDEGGRAGACWGDGNTALCYAQVLDSKIMMACGEVFFRQLDADLARHMAECPNPIMALLAVPMVMRQEGVSAAEAGRRLVAEVTERTAGRGTYEQETVVARVQRAVRGERGGSNNPYGCKGKPDEEINRDPITVNQNAIDAGSSPPTIPLPVKPEPPPPLKRDYSREAPTGTSVSYALRRLGRERDEDEVRWW